MKHANLSDIDAVERVVSVMYSHYTIEFHDWARSLLPEAAVVTFFLADTPVCWNVDFEIVVPEGLRRGTREAVANDATAHNLKIWAIALKYCLRRADDHKQEVTRFISRFEDTVAEEWEDYCYKCVEFSNLSRHMPERGTLTPSPSVGKFMKTTRIHRIDIYRGVYPTSFNISRFMLRHFTPRPSATCFAVSQSVNTTYPDQESLIATNAQS